MTEPAQPAPQPPAKAPFFKGTAAVVIAVVVGIVVLSVVGVVIYRAANGGSSSSGSTNVTLKVDSDGSTADITFGALTKSSQANGASMPWYRSATVDDGDVASLLSIVAQADESATYITCTIMKGSETVSTNTSTGAYAVVTC